jgi:hypothetical protein
MLVLVVVYFWFCEMLQGVGAVEGYFNVCGFEYFCDFSYERTAVCECFPSLVFTLFVIKVLVGAFVLYL